MDGAQITAFKLSSLNVSPSQLLLVICSVLAVVYLCWLAWLVYAEFRLWQEGKGDFYRMMFITSKGAVIAMFTGYLFTP